MDGFSSDDALYDVIISSELTDTYLSMLPVFNTCWTDGCLHSFIHS